MSDYAQAINQHYGQAELSAKILTALREAGKDVAALTRDDLVPFDEHHRGGREATRELARLGGLREGMHVSMSAVVLGGRRAPSPPSLAAGSSASISQRNAVVPQKY